MRHAVLVIWRDVSTMPPMTPYPRSGSPSAIAETAPLAGGAAPHIGPVLRRPLVRGLAGIDTVLTRVARTGTIARPVPARAIGIHRLIQLVVTVLARNEGGCAAAGKGQAHDRTRATVSRRIRIAALSAVQAKLPALCEHLDTGQRLYRPGFFNRRIGLMWGCSRATVQQQNERRQDKWHQRHSRTGHIHSHHGIVPGSAFECSTSTAPVSSNDRRFRSR